MNCKKAVGNGPNLDFDLSELKDYRNNPMKFEKGEYILLIFPRWSAQ